MAASFLALTNSRFFVECSVMAMRCWGEDSDALRLNVSATELGPAPTLALRFLGSDFFSHESNLEPTVATEARTRASLRFRRTDLPRFQIPDVGFQISDVRFQIPDFRSESLI